MMDSFVSGEGTFKLGTMNMRVTVVISVINWGSGMVISVLTENVTFPGSIS